MREGRGFDERRFFIWLAFDFVLSDLESWGFDFGFGSNTERVSG
jgi:hypothetical protein